MNTFDEFRTTFFDFYNAIKSGHLNTNHTKHGGHGLDHDITVAMLAVKIAPSIRIGQMAWCASMLHSTDRVVDETKVKDTMIEYSEYLKHIFNSKEIDEIIEAAMRHSERNQTDQSEVQITLMDADRLANLQSAVVIRSGQFRAVVPVFEFKYLEGKPNPKSSYDNCESVLDDLRCCISSYLPQFRLPIAKQLGGVYAERISKYIQSVEQDNSELGLVGIEL